MSPGPVMLLGAGTWGVALAVFGLMANPWAGLARLAPAGAADSPSVISRSTIAQTHTPDALLGRGGVPCVLAVLGVGAVTPELRSGEGATTDGP
ncbi:hypothetical protein [Streptomyces sp. SAS_276]|uniref:hypothetical protein n=1 Tax=Streptomyces sp. SAS_276 TaxID=3412745 RepID=UPI00403D39B0